MSVYVIVDDNDSGLRYSPRAGSGNGTVFKNASAETHGWFIGAKGDSPEFQLTTTGTGLDSSTLSYTFNGSSISVFGTYAGGPTTESFSTTNVTFSIDGNIIEENTYPYLENQRFHFPFFSYISTSFSVHTLDIDIAIAGTSSTIFSDFLFDYIIYEASVNSSIPTTEDGTSWIFIDDSSPYLTPSDNWSRNGALPDFSTPLSGENITDATLNSTVLAPTASGATISLNFTGTSRIDAYGMLLQNTSSGQLGTYTIDDQTSSPLEVPSPASSYPIYLYQLLTATIEDPHAPHVLTITAFEGNAFFLDYILLQTGSAFVTSASLNSVPPAPNTTQEPDPVLTTLAAPRKKSDAGAIAGGVVGGVLALCLVGLAVIFLLRRRRMHNPKWTDISVEERYSSAMQEQAPRQSISSGSFLRSDHTTTPTPFSTTSSGDNSGHSESQSRKIANYRRGVVPISSPATNINTGAPVPGLALPERQEGMAELSVVVENDSGLRGRELAKRLPPQYTPE
ncbi:uncharacterized protein STEHIDRAFT_159753 [Stereum hirsutum FP-91666 SS1]|uniref:uncharacterized protein n=1 Tax=Stereum hirsutum (strain FP-91666) TaxID=721885 RepID=UPI000444996E|nr:uncharacterized protein STEHIDRAFT_159753 [Stereum hirsutum FP-91666 SS1]EIM84160.1 hypothetical protein STEHIDRAFT_159753 [Stereum hirsutum FP-91666 SS1]